MPSKVCQADWRLDVLAMSFAMSCKLMIAGGEELALALRVLVSSLISEVKAC